jgi:hypothetical protein
MRAPVLAAMKRAIAYLGTLRELTLGGTSVPDDGWAALAASDPCSRPA